ncbi:MAG: glycosyltransferase, partial [Burkholderiales bacterium]|nr:glycosyltransferase [Burkholderiales bacterium]
MDWRITDSIADPAGTADDHHTERLWRIDPLFLTWRPPGSAPDVTLPPSAVRSGFTFGSYNNFAKVTDRTMALWGRVLQAVPESRLVLKTMSLSDAEVQIRARSRLIQQGCDPDRIEIRGPVAGGSGHLASYGDIDVALDTHPYNGTTTTCESLWMGVPVITLRGDRHASRVGASLLSAIGLDDLVADNPDDYVRLAAMLARDAPRLAALRRGLRDRVKQSALVDAVGFTRALENAYRSMGRAHTDRSTVAVAR